MIKEREMQKNREVGGRLWARADHQGEPLLPHDFGVLPIGLLGGSRGKGAKELT